MRRVEAGPIPDAAQWWPGPGPAADTLKERIAAADARLVHAFKQGSAIETLLAIRSWYIEQALLEAWRQTGNDSSGDELLLAVGGFGRGELHLHSDVDVLVLAEPDRERGAALERFFALLWDQGLKVGHAVCSIAECGQLARNDLIVATSWMDARRLAGSAQTHRRFEAALQAGGLWEPVAYRAAKRAERNARHHRYHDTLYNLEPNVKEGPGGLRDLQTVLWVANRQLGARGLEPLLEHGLLTAREYHDLKAARTLLWRIRQGLHLLAGRAEERLLFEHQQGLARLFGWQDRPGQGLAVEQFMQNYYRAAQQVERITERVWQRLETLDRPSASALPGFAEFEQVNGYLNLRSPHALAEHPHLLMQAFLCLLEYPQLLGLHTQLLAQIEQALERANGALLDDAHARAGFLALLRHRGDVAGALKHMHHCGVLGALIPAFAQVWGRMQYDLFHAYTVDQHTLFLIQHLVGFAHPDAAAEFPLAHEAYARLRSPEPLLLAGLFHDLAKGRGGDHSQLGAVEAEAFCRILGMAPEDVDLVRWLVQEHLLMSATAQKRDIQDPQIVRTFADAVGNTARLDHLYLLTVADIRATNPKLWTAWKGRLLDDLHRAARQCLVAGPPQPADRAAAVRVARDAAHRALQYAAVPLADAERLWLQFPDDVFLRYGAEQLAWISDEVWQASPHADALRVAARGDARKGATEVFVYAPDRDGLFATVTAVFDRMQFEVLEAKVMGTRHGWSLDVFHVVDRHEPAVQDPVRIDALRQRLAAELSQPDWRLQPARRVLSRRQRQFALPARIELATTPDGRTQLLLECADHPGLLAHVAAAFRQCGVRVHDARIATFGERAEDAFVLTDRHDQALGGTLAQALRAVLSQQLEQPYRSEGSRPRDAQPNTDDH